MHEVPVYADVVEAAQKLKRVARQTPLLRCEALEDILGRPAYVKCEPLQLTGSFKIRGAYNRLCRFSEGEKQRGAVAFSSGNHAQGVSRAARLLGMPAVIVMPKDTPEVKVEGVRADGAEVVFYDRYSESREEIAATISRERGSILVPSYDDFHVIAGQGSCGLEIIDQWPLETPPEALVCCVGGGGLIAGVSLAMKEVWPKTSVWGAEPEEFDDFARSLEAGERVGNSSDARSICDALLSPSPGELTFAINKKNLSGIGLISDDDARNAMRFAFRHLKVVVEPGGAAALAAVLADKISFNGDGAVVVIMTGGNVDPGLYAEILKG